MSFAAFGWESADGTVSRTARLVLVLAVKDFCYSWVVAGLQEIAHFVTA